MVVPWAELEGLVQPYYAKAGNGRRPVGLSIMLRTYFMRQWFNLLDPGVDLGAAPAPDETTALRFRHLLEKHDLCGQMLDTVNLHLEAKGIRSATGMIVDATIVHAPSSTKNPSPALRELRPHQPLPARKRLAGLAA